MNSLRPPNADPEEHAGRMRALERLRAVETDLSRRVEVLRRWLEADLERHWAERGCAGTPPVPPSVGIIERWWRDPGPEGEGDRASLERIGVVAEWIAAVESAGAPGYAPGRGDGAPLPPLLAAVLADLEEARALRARAGIRPS